MTASSPERIPHWLMLDETMLRSATGARVIRFAQEKAEVFSGNSERNGATHWMKTNWDIPNVAASAIIDLRNGSAMKKMTAPPPASRERTAAQRFHPV